MAALPASAVVPTLLHPESDATEYVSLPYFDWDDVVEKPFAGTYEIQIDDAQNFNTPVASGTVPALISFYSPHEELPKLPDEGAYWWRVRYRSASGTAHNWTSGRRFWIGAPPRVVNVEATDGWGEIKTKLANEILDRGEDGDFIELRFPVNATFHLEQDYDSNDPSSEFLFYIKDHDNILINGQGSKIVIRATGPKCGFYYAQAAQHLQLKKLTVDYEADSLSQFGGTIVAIDDDGIGDTGHRDTTTNIPTPLMGTGTRGFTVEVDPDVYQNEAEFAQVDSGFFVNAENRQRIGSQGVLYTMDRTWQAARIGTSDQYYFKESSQTWWDRYAGELKVGDFFVSTERGGDFIILFKNVVDFVANDLTVEGSRGRYFIVRKGSSEFNRSINNSFLRTHCRILGGPSGGVNDKGHGSWHENVTIQSTRDDAFHTGVPVGSENVLLNSEITGAFRNSAWIQADRSWVEGNTISHAGTDGIALGGAEIDPDDDTPTYAAQVSVGLIKNNTVIAPRRSGIVSRPRSFEIDPDPESGDHNEYITLTGNTVRDHQSDEAVFFDYLASSEVSGNTVESTGVPLYPFGSVWRLYSVPALQIGFHFAHSEDVEGAGNEVRDPRIACSKRLVVETDSSNIDVVLADPSSGAHESWNCASVAAFTAAGTLAGDHDWTINADNFRVEVLDNTLLGSRAFGRVVSDVLPGKSATALDTHTMPLPQTLSPGTNAIRLQARFVFNALTTSGRGEARLGVEDSVSGGSYAVGLSASTTSSPVQLEVNTTTASLGSAGSQSTNEVWMVDATFRRVSSTSTSVDYMIRRSNGAPTSGTATVSSAVGASTAFDRVFLTFKQRAQVVFDFIQVTAVD